MKPKITLTIDGTAHKCKLPYEDADHALVETPCPYCLAPAPLKVAGARRRIAADDRAYESDGGCVACGHYLGLLRLETNTLFGVREDEAVLKGRCRVY